MTLPLSQSIHEEFLSTIEGWRNVAEVGYRIHRHHSVVPIAAE
jgi:hypothetical protein